MPYKDPEKQRAAMRKIMRERRKADTKNRREASQVAKEQPDPEAEIEHLDRKIKDLQEQRVEAERAAKAKAQFDERVKLFESPFMKEFRAVWRRDEELKRRRVETRKREFEKLDRQKEEALNRFAEKMRALFHKREGPAVRESELEPLLTKVLAGADAPISKGKSNPKWLFMDAHTIATVIIQTRKYQAHINTLFKKLKKNVDDTIDKMIKEYVEMMDATLKKAIVDAEENSDILRLIHASEDEQKTYLARLRQIRKEQPSATEDRAEALDENAASSELKQCIESALAANPEMTREEAEKHCRKNHAESEKGSVKSAEEIFRELQKTYVR